VKREEGVTLGVSDLQQRRHVAPFSPLSIAVTKCPLKSVRSGSGDILPPQTLYMQVSLWGPGPDRIAFESGWRLRQIGVTLVIAHPSSYRDLEAVAAGRLCARSALFRRFGRLPMKCHEAEPLTSGHMSPRILAIVTHVKV